MSRRIWPAVAGILAFVVFAGSMVFWYVSTAGHSDGEALSTTFVSQSQATNGELLTMDQEQDKVPDYSSPAALAISISWPLYEGGAKANPKSFTGVQRYDSESAAVLDAYRAARERAVSLQAWSGSPRGLLSNTEYYGRCSGFVATVVIDTLTPEFPQATARMYPWMSDPVNGWVKVGDTEHYDPDSYQPGDIFLTRGDGHTFIWIGEHQGVDDVIADAALGNSEGSTTRVGALRRSPIDPETGLDKKGRAYDVWRYQGTQG